ncbi:MAG TPA: GNAT family N-acetyltransferase [Microvirga sp.]|jgi:GNAT superfamily N-acetyltransferase|nr:GNAT family N-acetyltransferase [Microvirga sp.]
MALIRSWSATDIPEIARILAAGWRQAYGGFMPEAVLAPRTDSGHRAREIESWLTSGLDPETEALLIAEAESRVRGFIALRLGDKDGLGTAGFVPLLYIDLEAQRQGLGTALLLAGVDWLEARSPGALAISAFAQNPYRGFYDAIGGTVAKAVTVRIDGHPFEVVQYYWPNCEAIRAGLAARI